jgi:hypothetical protein
VVDNYSDQKLLSAIFDQAGYDKRMMPVITIAPSSTVTYSIRRVSYPFPVVLDYIDVDNAWAFNALIDIAAPESKGLVRTYDEATAAAVKWCNAQDKMHRIKEMIVANGDRVSAKSQSTITIPTDVQSSMLKADTKADVNKTKQNTHSHHSVISNSHFIVCLCFPLFYS